MYIVSRRFRGLAAVHQLKTPLLFTEYEVGLTQSRSRYFREKGKYLSAKKIKLIFLDDIG